MSEEQVSDTIEKLYDRLDDYDKQQLMNYGYLMEYTRTLEKEIKYQNDIVINQKEVLDKIKEYVENLLKEEFEITDPDNINYGEKCQRAYFSDSELIKILDYLEENNE